MTETLELIQGTQLSRRHALKIFAATTTGVIASRYASVASAAKTYEDVPPQAALLEKEGDKLKLGVGQSYGKMDRQGDPTIALEPGGKRLWTTWSGEASQKEEIEAIQVRSFSLEDNTWGELITLAKPENPKEGCCFQSEVAFIGGKLLVVWTEHLGKGSWGIRSCLLDPKTGKPDPVVKIMGQAGRGEVHWYPAVASNGTEALIVWQADTNKNKQYDVFGQWVGQNGSQLFQPFAIETKEACRPSVAASPDGKQFAIAYDKQDAPGNQNIYTTLLRPGERKIGDKIRVSSHPASDLCPAIAYGHDGKYVWISWHSNRLGTDKWDIPKWYQLRALRLEDNMLMKTVGKPDGVDLDCKGTVQSFELTRLAVTPSGAVCVLGRPSQSFYLQYFTDEKNAPLYRLPKDGWGGRGRFLRGVFDDKGNLWTTARHLGTNMMYQVEGFGTGLKDPEVVPVAPQPKATLANVSKKYTWDPVKLINAGGMEGDTLHLLMGDVHNHTWQSDGMGDPEEIYLRNRDVYKDDFTAVTDHTRFVRKRLADAEWQQQKDLADHYNKDGEFITLYGQEWTTARTNKGGYGHFNVYSDDPAIPLIDRNSPTKKIEDFYKVVRKHKALAWPHHIGWTGVPWGEVDFELTPCMEMVSGHGAFEYFDNKPIEPRGDMKGNFVQDGLKLGFKFGMLGASDQHGLIWHHGICWKRDSFRSGLAGVWATDKTRKAWLDAVCKRRIFATSGFKMSMKFWIDAQFMGEELKTNAAPHLTGRMDVPKDQGTIKALEVVRNNETVHRLEGEKARELDWKDEECPADGKTSWYYLRLTLEEEPINMAWSSPIWVTRV